MDNERNRKNHYMTMVLWIMVIVFDVSAMVALTVWGRLENEVLIAAVVMSVFLLAIGIFAIWYTYRNHIEPARNDGNTGKTTAELREAKIHKRRKGRDMFEVCDNYRRQYFMVLYGVIGVFSLLLPFVFILKFNEFDNVHIPFWWAFIVAAAVMGISVFASRKSDLVFYTGMNLRSEIMKKGFDEFYVNNDFMMATYHDLLKGFLAVGRSYYVVFAQNFCRVAEMENVVKAEHCPKDYTLNSQKITRHFIRITEKDGSVTNLVCADNIAAELILGEFLKAGIETAALPAENAK